MQKILLAFGLIKAINSELVTLQVLFILLALLRIFMKAEIAY